MITTLVRLAAGLLLLAALAGCGDDGGSVFDQSGPAGGDTTSVAPTTTEGASSTTASPTSTETASTTNGGDDGQALGGGVASALAQGLGSDVPLGAGDEARCVNEGLAGVIAPERFAELDALAAGGDMTAVFGEMTDDEIDALIAVIDDCVDLEALVAEEMQGQGMSPEAISCFAGSFSQEDTLRSLIAAALVNESPETDPEFLALMGQIMTEDCAEPMEAMLVDQLAAEGMSQESAACVAEGFMHGGLFGAVVEAMVAGADLGSDPELMSRMMTVLGECLSPEELGGLGG